MISGAIIPSCLSRKFSTEFFFVGRYSECTNSGGPSGPFTFLVLVPLLRIFHEYSFLHFDYELPCECGHQKTSHFYLARAAIHWTHVFPAKTSLMCLVLRVLGLWRSTIMYDNALRSAVQFYRNTPVELDNCSIVVSLTSSCVARSFPLNAQRLPGDPRVPRHATATPRTVTVSPLQVLFLSWCPLFLGSRHMPPPTRVFPTNRQALMYTHTGPRSSPFRLRVRTRKCPCQYCMAQPVAIKKSVASCRRGLPPTFNSSRMPLLLDLSRCQTRPSRGEVITNREVSRRRTSVT